MLFYVALGTFAVVVGADRIAQTMYDFAQRISHLRFGWMILVAILGESSIYSMHRKSYVPETVAFISFPPCTGFTTSVTLCGFAYGMKGFYVAAAGTMLGSATVFSVLRFLFSRHLRKWASKNDK